MFQLFTGPFHALEKAFATHLLEERQKDPMAPLLVVSPSGHSRTRLQRQIALHSSIRPGLKKHPGGFLNIHFLDFQGLAGRIMEEGEPGEGRPDSSPMASSLGIPDARRVSGRVVREPALLREILRDFLEGREEVPFLSRKELVHSGQAVPKGLAGALASTLKDLQDSGARVVDLAQVAREGHLGDALEDAIPVLELNVLLYDVLRKRGLRVNADLLRRAAERVQKSAWIQSQKAVYIYGFYDLTGVQLELALALASHPNAHVYFPYEEGNPVYAFAAKLLKDPVFTSKCKPKSSSPSASVGDPSLNAVMDSPPTTAGNDDRRPSVEAWSCSGSHDEIWLAAKKILELARQGVPYHEMCLTARMLDSYLGVIREILEAHRIPYSLHAEEPVGAWPLVKNIWAALRGIQGRGEAIWSEHTRVATTILQRVSSLNAPVGDPSLTSMMDSPPTTAGNDIWRGGLMTTVAEGIQSSIESLAELDILGRPVSWGRFLEVVEEKLDALRLKLAPDNNQGVQVMDVMAARGLAFRAVFLVGLNEKLFPRLIREDPFLSDAARSGLAQAIGCRIPRKLDGYQEERLLFALATGLAGEHLHLSFQRSDEEGKALVTSLYLQEYIEAHGLKLRRLSRAWSEKFREVGPETLTPKEISLLMNRAGQDPSALYNKLAWDTALYHQLVRSQSEIEAFGTLGPHDGLIGEKHPAAITLLQEGLSPATLKDLAECPFKIFARKVLSLDPEESPMEGGVVTRTGIGTLTHEILERFYREGAKHLERAKNEVFQHFEKDHPELYWLPWQAAKDKIAVLLAQFVKADLAELKENGLIPKEFEIDLSATMDLDEKVLLHGRIDRLDLGHSSFRVVDYKTGSGGVKKGEKVETAILKGKVFQLPIYLLLAENWLRSQHPSPQPSPFKGEGVRVRDGSAVFYNLQKPDAVNEPLEITSTFWTEHGDQFNKNMKFLVKDIDKGTFYIRPSDNRGYCSWCHFAALCRKSHKPTRTRSENSPQHQAHEDCFR